MVVVVVLVVVVVVVVVTIIIIIILMLAAAFWRMNLTLRRSKSTAAGARSVLCFSTKLLPFLRAGTIRETSARAR